MLDFEEARDYLTELADDLPRGIFDRLNGGIVLVPNAFYDAAGLLILGHYHVQPMGLGRYITIYYGSFEQTYAQISPAGFKRKLKEVLYHELTHHLEHLAGDRSLEIQDEIDRARIMARRGGFVPPPRIVLKKREEEENG